MSVYIERQLSEVSRVKQPLIKSSALAPTGTTQVVNFDQGMAQTLDLGSASGNVTVTLSNMKAGVTYILKIIQAASAKTVTFSGAVTPGGSGITLSSTNDAEDLVCIFYDGSTAYVSGGNQDFG